MKDRFERSYAVIGDIRVPVSGSSCTEDHDMKAKEMASRIYSGICPGSGAVFSVHKRSVDARRKNDIKLVYSVIAEDHLSEKNINKLNSGGVKVYPAFTPFNALNAVKKGKRPVIVGFGPAGMFCALLLAEKGLEPLVLERGEDVESRVRSVGKFYETGVLDTESNIQFGAGGAGTFSDGKLTTRISSPYCRYVTEKFAEFGAPQEILHMARAHIGTDILRDVVANITKRIRELGGEIRFGCRAEIHDGYVSADGEKIDSDAYVIATGHSATDIYDGAMRCGYTVVPKAYSVGVRIEHLCSDIDRAMFGDLAGNPVLGHAEYNLSHREGERGVYTFCMCPGGEVVAAACDEGGVITNGMSNYRRDGRNSNSAVAVSVLPQDISDDPVKAIQFQKELERRAFAQGGSDFSAPCQTVGDFLAGKSGTEPGAITPTYMNGRVRMCDLHGLFPGYIDSMLATGLQVFGKKIKGFDRADAVLTGVESRTSSPVRMVRTEGYHSEKSRRIYPCGEGAGYAGGIMSAAVDGINVAVAVINNCYGED